MSIYQNLYDIIVTYIFGGAVLTPIQELVTTLFSVGGCAFLVALPFVVVWKVCLFIIEF